MRLVGEFEGFDAEVPGWFEGLENDNSRDYFAAHRPYYERAVRGQFSALLADLAAELGGETEVFRSSPASRRATSGERRATAGEATGASPGTRTP